MKKILVTGPILSRSGYGEHARFLMRALRKYEGKLFEIYANNTGWGRTSWQFRDTDERKWLDHIIGKTVAFQNGGGTYDISAQVTIPNEWQQLAPINIGVTAGIEVDRVSPAWIEKSELVNKIIVVSNHSKQVYERTSYSVRNEQTGVDIPDYRCRKPIDVVHYPIKSFEKADPGIDFETNFNFLLVAQWGPRKAVGETLKGFLEEFEDNPDVGLVLKTFSMNNSHMDELETEHKIKAILKHHPDRKCKVYLIHGSMSEEELHSLYIHPKIKALVSLTHGEGFGLPLFEAAYSGLPIIAPEWSGHLDFLTMPVADKKKKKTKIKPMFATVDYTLRPIDEANVWPGVLEKESMWCYSEPVSYKQRLRQMYSDHTRHVGHAKKLKKHVLENFQAEDKYDDFVRSILGPEFEQLIVDPKDLPKISLITSIYKGDEFIRPFLEDVTRQTIFKEKCELIMINANSPGNEEEVIKEYMEKFPDNIIYKKLDEDPGIYGVWNMGVEMATGEYLTNANLDDRKAVDALEKHATALYISPTADLVYADMLITEKPNETFEENSANRRKYDWPQFSFENLKMVNMPHASPMWRKSLHEKYGVFEDKYKSAGDWEMWLRAASQGSQFKKINDVLGLYYFNPTGMSTNPENFEWKREEETEIYEKYSPIKLEQ